MKEFTRKGKKEEKGKKGKMNERRKQRTACHNK
jgi:hypothetical protein